MTQVEESPQIVSPQAKARIFGKKITASGFLFLIVSGNFWVYYQLFDRKHPPFLDALAAIGMVLLLGGVVFYAYSCFASSEE